VVEEEENLWPSNANEPQWDIPQRTDHPQLDNLLNHITRAKIPDYVALHCLAKCTPPNHFTALCQHLCIEGAAQYLSGRVQTVNFGEQNLEDLFWDLEWRLSSKSAKNSFYEACGHPPPHPPMREECHRTFQKLHNEWKRRVDKYGLVPTNKFFRRRDGASALYLFLFHTNTYANLESWAQSTHGDIPNPFDTIWAEYLVEDADRVGELGSAITW
jgi:hypothetical protein